MQDIESHICDIISWQASFSIGRSAAFLNFKKIQSAYSKMNWLYCSSYINKQQLHREQNIFLGAAPQNFCITHICPLIAGIIGDLCEPAMGV